MRSVQRTAFLLLLGCVFYCLNSQSIYAEMTSSQIIEEKINLPDFSKLLEKMNGSIGIGSQSNFHRSNDFSKSQSAFAEFSLSYSGENWNSRLITSVTKDLQDIHENTLWDDSIISFSRGLKLFSPESSFKSTGIIVVTAATSLKSRDEKSMYGSLTLIPSINWSQERFGLTINPSVGKIFNQYTTTWEGESNSGFFTKLSLRPSYQFSDNFTSYVAMTMNQSWTEKGDRKSPKYKAEMGIEWGFMSQTSLSLDVTTEGSAYKSNGRSYNVSLYERDTSEYAVTLKREF